MEKIDLEKIAKEFLDVQECVRFYPPDIEAVDDYTIIHSTQAASKEISLYIHIPFCKSPCGFCPFNQYNYSETQFESYIDSLKKEMVLINKSIDFSLKNISSIWIGGGTPLDLSEKQLTSILDSVSNYFEISRVKEFTIEGKPVKNMITPSKLEILVNHGVTRISLGIQSTQDKYLKLLGRNYTFEDVLETVRLIHSYGIEINADMIYRLPNETSNEIKKDIENILKCNIDHISWFHYIWHIGTPLTNNLIKNNVRRDVDRDSFYEMYKLVQNEMLQSGYTQYTPYYYTLDKKCQYHVDRWKMPQVDVVGLGAGAFSAYNNWVYANAHNLDLYCNLVNGSSLPITIAKKLDEEDIISRYVVLGCKFFELSNDEFKKRTGYDLVECFGEKLEILKNLGLIVYDESGIRCTNYGGAFNNTIAMFLCREIYYKYSQPQPLQIRKEGH